MHGDKRSNAPELKGDGKLRHAMAWLCFSDSDRRWNADEVIPATCTSCRSAEDQCACIKCFGFRARG